MLCVLKKSSVQSIDSLMEANAKNLDTFLTVEINILNKRGKLSLRHADRWKWVPVVPSCALHQELADCFYLPQCLCCAEEEGEPHSLCLGAPQGSAGSTTWSTVLEQKMGFIPGALWLWACGRTHLPGMFSLAGSSLLALGLSDISCNCCYLWFFFSSCLYESLLKQPGYPRSPNSACSWKADSSGRIIMQVILNHHLHFVWEMSMFCLSLEFQIKELTPRSPTLELAVCPGISLFHVSFLAFFYLSFPQFSIDSLFVCWLWSSCKQRGPHVNKYPST